MMVVALKDGGGGGITGGQFDGGSNGNCKFSSTSNSDSSHHSPLVKITFPRQNGCSSSL